MVAALHIAVGFHGEVDAYAFCKITVGNILACLVAISAQAVSDLILPDEPIFWLYANGQRGRP